MVSYKMVDITDSTLFVEDNENENGHSCIICYEKLDDKSPDKVTLKCNHTFCYECLLESYKGTKCNFTNHKTHRICPYCRTPAGYLSLKDGMTPLKGIHREHGKKTSKSKLLVDKCKGIIKTGKNKGNQCGCNCKIGSDYCGRHGPK